MDRVLWVGRGIHVETVIGCVYGVVTGNIRRVQVNPDRWEFDATLFSPMGPVPDAARRVKINRDTEWHVELDHG